MRPISSDEGRRLSRPLTREEALRLLELPASAGPPAVKQAYRRLARRHHPDVGGDPATFHQLRLAFERLVDDEPRPADGVVRGRPSRPGAAWRPVERVDTTPVNLDRIDWGVRIEGDQARLGRDLLAVRLASGGAPLVQPVRATSRAPGSRLNRLAAMLSPDLTAHLEVRTGTDDRGSPVVVLEVAGSHRRARRALDRVPLEGLWLRLRGSSTTVVRSSMAPSPQRRATALRAVDRLERLLDRLEWPLEAWTLTR